ncbi:hypothetical protein DFP73DRAFT_152735 [Morchella snyderi]|nr:hypothetical protein DFP73DRAFT_152735 [Morchella snyderi]
MASHNSYPNFTDLSLKDERLSSTISRVPSYHTDDFWPTQKKKPRAHLRPRTLPKRDVSIRRKKAGWMFFPTFLLSAALPIAWLVLWFTTTDDEKTCRLDENSAPIFGINYSIGVLSFTAAKWVDVAFDVVVGHGGQALLCWASYRAILDTLSQMMESDEVSYELFITLTMNGSTFLTLLAILKRIATRWEHRGRMTLIFLVTAYVLIFPTLMAAMTGYSTRAEGWFILNDGNLVTHDTFLHEMRDAQIILDGSRIGMEDNATFSLEKWAEISGANHTEYEGIGHEYRIGDVVYRVGFEPLHTLFGYQFRGEAYDMAFTSNPSRHRCIATEKYQYGVSTVIFRGTIVLQMLWTYTIYALWVHANRKGQLCSAGRKLGPFRAVADLAGAMKVDLGENASAYPDKVLEKECSRSKPGLRYYIDPHGDGTWHVGLSSGRPKDEVLVLDDDARLYK